MAAVLALTPPATQPAAVATGLVPTWLVGSIKRFCDVADPASAVEHFDLVCRQGGLGATMPCAIAEMRIGGCTRAACQRCTAQTARGAARIATPAGLIAKIKAASNTSTAALIRG